MAAPRSCSSLGRQFLIAGRPRTQASSWTSASCQKTRRSTYQQRCMSSAPAGLRSLLRVSEEVADAVATKKPVVALESTIYTHGAMGKQLAQEHDELVRKHGAIPAIIGILDGVPNVGLTPEEIVRMIEDKDTVKVSRRDISYLVGMGLAGRKINGGTTIAGTMVLARLAGISVFGTGGLGGVHRDGHNTMDISADLTELGRTRVAVVSSGCKGFLDIPRTLEYLETQGCLISTFADGRTGNIDFPGFWARESGSKSPSVVQNEKEAAAIIYSQEQLGIESGMLFANPVPEGMGIPLPEIQAAIETAVTEANEKGFTGSRNTPYVLGRLKELTGNKAVVANIALVESNIIRATNVAVELSRLQSSRGASTSASSQTFMKAAQATPMSYSAKTGQPPKKTDILVAGAVALDLNCDYASKKAGDVAPHAHVSNPARIGQSVGGVGHNVALAAHRASMKNHVKLCSMVGDDVAGSTILAAVEASGLDVSHVKKLGQEYKTGNRTAQYVAVNDGEKNLVMAMADMDILTTHSFPDHWRSIVETSKPDWLVVDGNWSGKDIREWVRAGGDNGCKVAFEPVSAAKSRGLFAPQRGLPKLGIYPNTTLSLASPNTYELEAMYEAAKENGYLESMEWFQVVDWFGMRGARERFLYLTSAALTDAGVPVQAVQLLPYIPTIITKLGADGVLLTELLGKGDPRLTDPDSEEYILTRCHSPNSPVGGIYMRLYPAAEKVTDVVSVNGVGDTFLGVMISGLAQGGKVEKLVDVAQKGAVHTLRSAEAVSPNLGQIEEELTRVVSRKY